MPAAEATLGPPAAGPVTAAFGLAGPKAAVVAVTGAYSHRMWRLTTDEGSYAVKQFMNPWGESDWQSWLRVAAEFELACFETRIAIPEPILTLRGEVLVEVPTTSGQPTTVRLHRWVDATPCPPGPVSDGIASELGATLARIHRLAHRPARRDVFPHLDRHTVDGWPELVSRLRGSDPELADLASGCRDLVAAVSELFPLADYSAEPMGHGDIAQKNVLIGSGRPLVCDWDVAAPWPASAELARTALALADWSSPHTAGRVVGGYRAAGGEDRPIRSEDLSLDLVISLDWLELCFRRAGGLDQAADPCVRDRLPNEVRQLRTKIEIGRTIDRWLGSRRE